MVKVPSAPLIFYTYIYIYILNSINHLFINKDRYWHELIKIYYLQELESYSTDWDALEKEKTAFKIRNKTSYNRVKGCEASIVLKIISY